MVSCLRLLSPTCSGTWTDPVDRDRESRSIRRAGADAMADALSTRHDIPRCWGRDAAYAVPEGLAANRCPRAERTTAARRNPVRT